jgi:hypothetical protein
MDCVPKIVKKIVDQNTFMETYSWKHIYDDIFWKKNIGLKHLIKILLNVFK